VNTASEDAIVETHVEAILAHWDLGEVHAAVELSGGMFLRPLRLVTDKGSFVLRGHTFRVTEESFRFQFDIVNGCADAGIPCPRIIPTRDGSIGVGHSGAFMAIHEYAKGKVHDWASWQGLKSNDAGFLHRLGGEVSRMHAALGRLKPGGDPGLAINLPPMRFGRIAEQREDFESAAARLVNVKPPDAGATREAFLGLLPRCRRQWVRIAKWTKDLGVEAIPTLPVHGDVSAVNMVFPDETAPPVFIDWDACHAGLRMYDALGDVLNRPPHEKPEWNLFHREEVESYVSGYRESADPPVSDAELGAVPLFCLARQMEDLRQRLFTIDRVTRDFDEANAILVRRRVEMMEQIEHFELHA